MTERNSVPDHTRTSPELLVLTWLAGTTLAPFIQAIATKGAEDLYLRLRRLFRSADRDRAERQIRGERELILVDESARAILLIPSAVHAAQARALATVRAPAHDNDGWVVVAWDKKISRWTIGRADSPPPDAIIVTRPDSDDGE
jgi:hypothetical protein